MNLAYSTQSPQLDVETFINLILDFSVQKLGRTTPYRLGSQSLQSFDAKGLIELEAEHGRETFDEQGRLTQILFYDVPSKDILSKIEIKYKDNLEIYRHYQDNELEAHFELYYDDKQRLIHRIDCLPNEDELYTQEEIIYDALGHLVCINFFYHEELSQVKRLKSQQKAHYRQELIWDYEDYLSEILEYEDEELYLATSFQYDWENQICYAVQTQYDVEDEEMDVLQFSFKFDSSKRITEIKVENLEEEKTYEVQTYQYEKQEGKTRLAKIQARSYEKGFLLSEEEQSFCPFGLRVYESNKIYEPKKGLVEHMICKTERS